MLCIIRPSHVPPESGLCYEPDSLGVKSIEKVRIDVKMNRSCFHIYSYLAMVFYTQWIWFITQTSLWRDVGGANNTEHGALASTLSSNTSWDLPLQRFFFKTIGMCTSVWMLYGGGLLHVLLQEVEARQPSTVLFAPPTSLPRVVCVMNQIHWV